MAFLGLPRLLARGRTLSLGVFLAGTRRWSGAITSLGLVLGIGVATESHSGTLWRRRGRLSKLLESRLEIGPATLPDN